MKPALPALATARIDAPTGPSLLLLAHTAPTAEPEPQVSSRVLLLFVLTYAAYAILYLARKPVSVVKTTLESELKMSVAALGRIDSALLLAYTAGQLLLGKTVAIFGRTLPLVLAYALSGASTAAFGLASSSGAMTLAWAASGFFAAPANPLMVILIGELFPASLRATAIGAWASSQQLGGVVANLISAYVLGKSGWRAVFLVSGGLIAAFAPLLAIALPLCMPRGANTTPSKGAAPAKPVGTTGKSVKSASALSVPGSPAVAAGYTFVKMARYCLMFWLPFFLSKYCGLSAPAAASVATTFDIGGAIGNFGAGVLCDRLYGGRMLLASLHLCLATAIGFAAWGGLCMATAGQPPPLGAHVALISLIGFFIAGPDGILGGGASRMLVDYSPETAGDRMLYAAVSGMVNGCGSIGALMQGLFTSQLVGAVGWAGLYFTLALATLAGAGVLLPAVAVEDEAQKRLKAK
mmetsp:Transcript_29359/g.89932  ORF Transcript_29359/g.89932 Transcript_29359/m.89932 type:complete len:466 (+) Transcript_29359:57-1454(+)